MTKMTKKVQEIIAAHIMGADMNEIKNPEKKIYTYSRGISGNQIIDFNEMTHKFYSIVSRNYTVHNLTEDVNRILSHIDEVKNATGKEAFEKFFDKIYNNTIMEDLIDPDPIDTCLIKYLKKELRKEGYRKEDIEEAESDAVEMANQYVDYHKVCWNYNKVFEEDFNRAERNRI